MYLPDESYFGLNGRCPECGHKFELTPLTSEITAYQESPHHPANDSVTLTEAKPNPVSPANPHWRAAFDEAPDSQSNDLEAGAEDHNRDEESINLEDWDRDEATFDGPNPFHLEQGQAKKIVPPAEGTDGDSQDDWQLNQPWNTGQAKRQTSSSEEAPSVSGSFTWEKEAEQSTNPDRQSASRSSGTFRVRCPHCEAGIDCPSDSKLSALRCPRCNGTFNLVNQTTQIGKSPRLETIGHFQLLEPLGIGAFGTVYKAHDSELDRIVAVKIPRKEVLGPDDIEKFIREALRGGSTSSS